MDMLCPHFCYFCGSRGEILCSCCKKYLMSQSECAVLRLEDGKLAWSEDLASNLPCPVVSYARRNNEVFELVKEYKYQSVRALAEPLADCLKMAVMGLGLRGEVVVVSLPTAYKHIRARGFDHMRLIGEALAMDCGWTCSALLERRADTVQVGTDSETRKIQAQSAYGVSKELNPELQYLLLDDVWTTGSSMMAAINIMRKAGARRVCGAVICRA